MSKVLILLFREKEVFFEQRDKEKKRRILATENTEILFYQERKRFF